jgi:hypothetical protein
LNHIAGAELTVDEACARHGLPAELVQDWLRGFRRSVVSAFDEKLKRTLAEQGADVARSAAEFAGTLEEISIIDWIQSVEVTRKSAVISVAHNGSDSRVWFANGAILDAESGRLRGEPALYRIVTLEQGRVVVEFGTTRRARTIYTSTPSLLLEAAHRKDEAARLWRRLGDGRRAYRVTENAAQRTGYSSQAERKLLESFQQPRSLLEVFEGSELGDVETLTLLTQLSESQFIAADPSSTPARASEGEASALASPFRTLTALAVSSGEAASEQTGSGAAASGQRALPRYILPAWAWGGLAAVTLVTVAALSRPQASPRPDAGGEALASARSIAPAVAELPPALAPAEPASYVVATTVEPTDAAIWLDGQPVPSGTLKATLPKDGRAHELRAVAPGYTPALVVFVDAPPPGVLRLETLPALPVTPPNDSSVPAEPTLADDSSVPVQADVVVLTAKLPAEPARRPERARPRERTANAPAIQTIEAATPAIRIIP